MFTFPLLSFVEYCVTFHLTIAITLLAFTCYFMIADCVIQQPCDFTEKGRNLIFEVLNRTQKSAITLEPHIRSVSKNFGIILAGGSLDSPKTVTIGLTVFSKNREPKSHCVRDTNIHTYIHTYIHTTQSLIL